MFDGGWIKLESIDLSGATSIGVSAACNNALLGKVILGEGLLSIGNYAFMNTIITEIIIPNSLTTWGGNTFKSCTKLHTVTLPNNPALTTIPILSFEGCTSLTTVSGLENFTALAGQIFMNCTSLQTLSMPKGIKLAAKTLANCISLTSLEIGTEAPDASVLVIAADAFSILDDDGAATANKITGNIAITTNNKKASTTVAGKEWRFKEGVDLLTAKDKTYTFASIVDEGASSGGEDITTDPDDQDVVDPEF